MKTHIHEGCNPLCRVSLCRVGRPMMLDEEHTIHTGDMLLPETRAILARSRRAALLASAARDYAARHKMVRPSLPAITLTLRSEAYAREIDRLEDFHVHQLAEAMLEGGF